MAIVHFVNYRKAQTNGTMSFVLNYTMQDKKTVADGKKFVTGINCTPECAYTEFRNTKRLYGKEDGRLFYHFVQSFPKGENITPEVAHEIALRFASESEKLKNFEIVVSTHCDRDHIHSHFVMNSVNSENGKKFHINENEIETLMSESDAIVQQYGLSVVTPKPTKKMQTMSDREYRSANKNESWKLHLAMAIDDAMREAVSREHFIELMGYEGYSVKWTDERKNITYTTPDGFKCRDNKLHEEKYLKGSMENEFRIRKEITAGIKRTGSPSITKRIESRALHNGNRTELESVAQFTENADRNAVGDTRRASVPSNRGTDSGIYEPADRLDKRKSDGELRYDGSVPSGDEKIGVGIYRADENGNAEYVITGWENERKLFEQSFYAGGKDEQLYSEVVSHQYDSDIANRSPLADTFYLGAYLTNVLDNDHPVEDCTTMKQPRQKKKKEQQRGPVMGGM